METKAKKQKPFGRCHGILMPIFSLDSQYGIGTLGEPSKKFVDFLARSGAAYWQVLPIGPTGYGNSPYQCFSAFGGNPLFIDPIWLKERGWLSDEDIASARLPNVGKIDYNRVTQSRKALFEKGYRGFKSFCSKNELAAFDLFCKKQAHWLDAYTEFMALKAFFNMVGRNDFKSFSVRSSASTAFVNKNLSEDKEFFAFLEYVFFAQWQELKDYANKKGVLLIGDIPLYVSNDSADVWGKPNLFLLDDKGYPTSVAGVPPDLFSKKGQLWGNPLYRWDEHEAEGFKWWKARIAHQAQLFDVIRIDHFIGICRYYAIPNGAQTAASGEWKKGPGKRLTDAFLTCADAKFIAEDLGVVTKEVGRLLTETGFPGMRIMQFAFDGDDNPNLTHNIVKNCVVYPGTHDNQTLAGFFATCRIKTRRNARLYLNVKRSRDLPEAVIRECFRSSANMAVIPFGDYLGLDDRARINTPSTLGDNWVWRYQGTPDDLLAEKIAALAAIYKRENNNDK